MPPIRTLRSSGVRSANSRWATASPSTTTGTPERFSWPVNGRPRASERYFDIKNLRLALGRPFTGQENRSGVPVVVLGDAVAQRLFADRTPLERRVRIGGIAYRVI